MHHARLVVCVAATLQEFHFVLEERGQPTLILRLPYVAATTAIVIVVHIASLHLHLLKLNSEFKCGSAGLVRIRKANYVSAELLTDQLANIQTNPDAFRIQVASGI